MINKRIDKLRELMKMNDIDIYIIFTADYHQSEYLADYFKTREYMSGFSGSQGDMIVTQDHVGLWVDGRYHVQAEAQTKDTYVELYKIGLANVPTLYEVVDRLLKDNGTIGFDGKTTSAYAGSTLSNIAKKKDAKVVSNIDLVGEIFESRGDLPNGKAYLLEDKYTGVSFVEKIADVKEAMRRNNTDVHVLCALDEICWLFNIRGSDIKHTPVVLSYAIITNSQTSLYIDLNKLDQDTKEVLNKSNITLKDYDSFLKDIKNISNQRVWLDKSKCHYALVSSLEDNNEIYNAPSVIVLNKAMKNEIEIENIKRVHELDGVAYVRFVIWLKENYKNNIITEISAQEKIEELRREVGAMDQSFSTISAFNEHGAMMHYSASKDTDKILNNGIYLIDSGAQYMGGTTDITRTFALGEVDDKYKKYCTMVLKSNLQLARANFLYGCSGLNLDILARQPIWDLNLDYQSGTGHGIGYMLGVHEGPQGFRYYISPLRKEDSVLEDGMVITDEPGLYFEGEFGCRIENELLVRKGVENYYGQFMHFEVITYAPIDTSLFDLSLLSEQDKDQLNKYHEMVYDKLSKYLNEEEKLQLKKLVEKI